MQIRVGPLWVLGFAIAILCSWCNEARAATPSVTINWTAPTVAADGTALTGAQAITGYQVWVSTTSIPDNVTGTPTATITGTATTITQSVAASPGDTIFARVKACNVQGCSVLTNQVSKALPISVPGPPTNVTITLNIG